MNSFLKLLLASWACSFSLVAFSSSVSENDCIDSLNVCADQAFDLIEIDAEKSLYYSQKTLELSKKCDNNWFEAHALKLIGAYYFYQHQYDSSNLYYRVAYENFLAINDSTYAADALGLFAQSLFQQGAVEEALEKVKASLEIVYDHPNSKLDLAYGILNSSILLSELNHPESLHQFKHVLELFESSKKFNLRVDGYHYAITNIFTSIEYLKLNQYDSVDFYLDNIEKQDTFFLSPFLEAEYYGLRAVAAAARSCIDREYEKYLISARVVANADSDSTLLTFNIPYYTAKCLLLCGDTAEALATINQALAEHQASWWNKKTLLEEAVFIYEKSNQLEKAYAYSMKIREIEDQIHLEDTKAQTISLQLQKEAFEKNQLVQEKQLLQEYKDKQEATNRVKNALIVALAIIALLGIILFVYIYKLSSERKQLVRSKDTLISVLGHDLRTPLAQVQGIINLAKADLVSKEDLSGLLDKMEIELENTQTKLENVLQWSKTQLKNTRTKTEKIQLAKAISESVAFNEVIIEKKKINMKVELANQSLHCLADPDQFQIILRNLISNAIKFSSERDTVRIKAYMNSSESNVYIEVIDNGVGMTEQVLKRIQKNKAVKSTEGSQGEKGTGLGLDLVKIFINANKGKLQVESILGKGSVFTVVLPSK